MVKLKVTVLVQAPVISRIAVIRVHERHLFSRLHMGCHIVGGASLQKSHRQIELLPDPFPAVRQYLPEQLILSYPSSSDHTQHLNDKIPRPVQKDTSGKQRPDHCPWQPLPPSFIQHGNSPIFFIQHNNVVRNLPCQLSLSGQYIQENLMPLLLHMLQELNQRPLRSAVSHGIDNKQDFTHRQNVPPYHFWPGALPRPKDSRGPPYTIFCGHPVSRTRPGHVLPAPDLAESSGHWATPLRYRRNGPPGKCFRQRRMHPDTRRDFFRRWRSV